MARMSFCRCYLDSGVDTGTSGSFFEAMISCISSSVIHPLLTAFFSIASDARPSWYNLFSLSYILLTSKNRERDVIDALVDRLDLSLLLCDGLCQNFQL